MKKVCVFIEQKAGVLTSNSQKILYLAQLLKEQYGYMIIVIVFDEENNDFLSLLKNTDADVVYLVRLSPMNQCLLKIDEVKKLAHFLEKLNLDIIWGCNSFGFKSLFPKLAYILKTGLCASCLGYRYEKTMDRIDMIRTAYSDNVYAQIAVHKSKPLMATILDDTKKYTLSCERPCSEIYDITADITIPGANKVEMQTIEVADNICLGTSKTVIGLGNGITKKSDLLIFKKLAGLLGNAAIGGTRELVNKQIIPQNYQIGSTGIQIYADLYIAFGISGSPQHIQGIEHVEKIIAVNCDPYAPIFQYANYGVVGDLLEVANYMINYIEGKSS